MWRYEELLSTCIGVPCHKRLNRSSIFTGADRKVGVGVGPKLTNCSTFCKLQRKKKKGVLFWRERKWNLQSWLHSIVSVTLRLVLPSHRLSHNPMEWKLSVTASISQKSLFLNPSLTITLRTNLLSHCLSPASSHNSMEWTSYQNETWQ